jgi:hypothetical protein
LVFAVACGTPDARESFGRSRARVEQTGSAAALVSTEFELDHAPLVERVVSCPRAVFGGSTFFVSHSARYDGQSQWREIAVTRFDRLGHALDEFAIPVASVDSARDCAPIVFTGTSSVITWANEGQLHCARVREDGTVLDAGGRATGFPATGVEDVAWDGTHALVLTSDATVGVLGDDCVGVGTLASLPRAQAAGFRLGSVAYDGTQFWVAYTETLEGTPDQFFAQPVSTEGAPIGTRSAVATATWTRTSTPPWWDGGVSGSVAARAHKTAFAYSRRGPNFGRGPLSYREISPSGALEGERTLSSSSDGLQPAMTDVGNGFVISDSMISHGTKLLRVGDDASVLETTFSDMPLATSLTHDGANPFLAASGSLVTPTLSFLLDTSRARLVNGDLASLAGPSVFAKKSDLHQFPLVAGNTDTSLVVWRNRMGILGSRVSRSGQIVDATPIAIHSLATETPYTPYVVASNGTDFIVAWNEDSIISAQRVLGAGEVTGPSFIVSDGRNNEPRAYGDTPAVASDGSGYLFVWLHVQSTLEVRAARVSAAGAVLDNPPIVLRSFALAHGTGGSLAVGYDGSAYVVASSIFPPYPPLMPIEIQRLSSAGNVLGSSQTPWIGELRAMTWGREEGIVVFKNEQRLVGGRFDARGAPLDAVGFTITNSVDGYAADHRNGVAWDGSNYWVSWKDSRRVEVTDDIYVARVAPTGAVLDPTGIEISRGIVGEHAFNPGGEVGIAGGALAASGSRVLAAYTRYENARETHEFILHGRFLDSDSGDAGGAGGEGSGGTSGAADGGPGAGGDAGAAGEPATGGNSGRTGSGGGTAATGGSDRPDTGGQAGRGGDLGAGGERDATGGSESEGRTGQSDAGCSCRVPAHPRARSPRGGLLAALVLLVLRFARSPTKLRRA